MARAIQTEIDEGRGHEGGFVDLDLTHLGKEKIVSRLPGIRQIAMEFAGVDPVTAPIPVQPGQHYSMGGVDAGTMAATSFQAYMPPVSVPALASMGRTGWAATHCWRQSFSERSREFDVEKTTGLPDRTSCRSRESMDQRVGADRFGHQQ